MIAKLPLLLSVIVLSTLDGTESCRCLHRNSSIHYCVSDFVLLVNITQIDVEKITLIRSATYTMRRYGFDTLEVFKSSPIFNQTSDKSAVITAQSSAACGVTLDFGEHLVSGLVGYNRLHTNLCGWNVPWKSVSLADQQSLHNGTFPNCSDII